MLRSVRRHAPAAVIAAALILAVTVASVRHTGTSLGLGALGVGAALTATALLLVDPRRQRRYGRTRH